MGLRSVFSHITFDVRHFQNFINFHKRFQEKLKAASTTIVEKTKAVEEESKQLIPAIDNSRKLIKRVKRANERLRNDAEEKLEFEAKYSALLDEFNEMRTQNAEMHNVFDKRRQDYDNLKRLQAEVLTKQQYRIDMASKVTALKTENSAAQQRIAGSEKNINEMKMILTNDDLRRKQKPPTPMRVPPLVIN